MSLPTTLNPHNLFPERGEMGHEPPPKTSPYAGLNLGASRNQWFWHRHYLTKPTMVLLWSQNKSMSPLTHL